MTRAQPWTPSAEQRALWPAISANTIDGVGEGRVRPEWWHVDFGRFAA